MKINWPAVATLAFTTAVAVSTTRKAGTEPVKLVLARALVAGAGECVTWNGKLYCPDGQMYADNGYCEYICKTDPSKGGNYCNCDGPPM
jgi:hypothetical protein